MRLVFCHAVSDPGPYYLQDINFSANASVVNVPLHASPMAIAGPSGPATKIVDGSPVWAHTRQGNEYAPPFDLLIGVSNMWVDVHVIAWRGDKKRDSLIGPCSAVWEKLWEPLAHAVVKTLAT
jgi:hypothetical protein